MYNFVYKDASEALPELSRALKTQGWEVDSRDGDSRSRVLEMTWVRTTLTNPVNREILVESRKANIFAQIAETMWVLSGRNDVEWLERYLP
jgi:thymidylate synthase